MPDVIKKKDFFYMKGNKPTVSNSVPEKASSREDGMDGMSTFDHQNLVSSSLSPSGRFCQILRNSLLVFLKYRVPENGTDGQPKNTMPPAQLSQRRGIIKNECILIN